MFVYQRIVMYFCYVLSDRNCLQNSWYSSKIISCLKLLKTIYSSVINVNTLKTQIITQQQLTKQNLQQILNTTMHRSMRQGSLHPSTASSVDETFQILRTVGEMEKNINELEKIIDVIVENGSVEELREIDKLLRGYLREEGVGVGAKSYENFIKTQMMISWNYMEVPPTPFLPPINKKHKYTVVLDLDQTIVYFNQQTKILRFRPGLDLFLKKLQTLNFELITFTASSKSYADSLIAQIERSDTIFHYRLYKQHLSLHQGKLIKDVRRLGRDMSKIVIIDDLSVNFCSCRENGIEVGSWVGERADRQLLGVLAVLVKLVGIGDGDGQGDRDGNGEMFGFTDVRKLLRSERSRLQAMLQNSQKNQFLNLN